MGKDERFVVPEEADGSRLDRLLTARASIGSRGKARRALSSGKVRVDGAEVGEGDGGRACPAGTVVEVAWTTPGTGRRRSAARRRMDASGVVVLFEDDELLALDKPPGMLTDAATRAQRREEHTLTDRARAWVQRGDVWPVHRIDRDTSGVVLFAKGTASREGLKLQWQGDAKPGRIYLAVLQGHVDGDPGWWEDWMRWDAEARRQVPCRRNEPGAVLGRSHVVVLERVAGATVVQVALDTGRRNQIRLSACLAGHPLVGERQYTPARVGVGAGKPARLPPLARQALHAAELTVRHPVSDAPLTVRSPLPADLEGWLQRQRRA